MCGLITNLILFTIITYAPFLVCTISQVDYMVHETAKLCLLPDTELGAGVLKRCMVFYPCASLSNKSWNCCV